jgi:hypothetical protein
MDAHRCGARIDPDLHHRLISKHAVDADRRKHTRDAGEYASHHGVEPWSGDGTCDEAIHGNHRIPAVSLVLFVVTMMSASISANQAASIQLADALRID